MIRNHNINLQMSAFLYIFTMTLVIHSHFTEGIEWTVDQKVFAYGQNLTLFCNIGHCCFFPTGWNKLDSKELIPIYIDVRNLTDASNDKYGGKTNKSGFFLIIRDFKAIDLNTEYSCTYDFNVSKMKKVQKIDAFKDLEWRVDQKVSSYGHDLTLFCNVGTCCEFHFRWSKWKSESQLSPQYINGDKDDKYNEKRNKSGFFLTIRNLTEDDLNTDYACVYNNRPGKRKHLLKSDAFYKESSLAPNPSLEKIDEGGSSGPNLVTPILIAVAVLGVVMFGILLIWKNFFRKHDTPSSPRNNHQHNTELQQDAAHVRVPLIHIETIQQEDRHDSLQQISQHNVLFVNLPKFNPERASSDRQISQTQKESPLLPSRLASSNVSFDNKKPAIVPPDIDYAGCSMGVLNTEIPNYIEFEKSNLSDSSLSSKTPSSCM